MSEIFHVAEEVGARLGACQILQRPMPENEIAMRWVGIDFGSKLAGTTCMAWLQEGSVMIDQSAKKGDADEWLITQVAKHSFTQIFIDAPLSLPPAFYEEQSTDFFYRQADRELKAMSPMFLGGLTARAMQLKRRWTQQDILVYETYPAALMREWQWPEYKIDLKPFTRSFADQLHQHHLTLAAAPQNWHQADALLAWMTGMRFNLKCHKIFGDKAGQIFV